MEVVVCKLIGVRCVVIGNTIFVNIEYLDEFKESSESLGCTSLIYQ